MQVKEDQFFVVTPPGLEQITAMELKKLALEVDSVLRGGIIFRGRLRELYLANMWLRSASRILVRLGEVGASDFPTLFQRLVRLPWGRFIKPGTDCEVKVVSQSSRLMHTGRIAETCTDAISKAVGSQCSSVRGGQKVFLRLIDNRCQVSIDSSGAHLHRRGYRRAAVNAPLRENLAAACLLACGYDGLDPVVDLMTGSGTFAAEAALIALRRAPGKDREFSFMAWPRYRHGLWRQLRLEAEREELSELNSEILAVDNNPRAIAAAQLNFDALGLGELIRLRQIDMQKLQPSGASGLLICNPPYGERLGKNAALAAFYHDIGSCYGQTFSTWKGALLCPESQQLKASGIHLRPLLRFSNGGIKVALWQKM